MTWLIAVVLASIGMADGPSPKPDPRDAAAIEYLAAWQPVARKALGMTADHARAFKKAQHAAISARVAKKHAMTPGELEAAVRNYQAKGAGAPLVPDPTFVPAAGVECVILTDKAMTFADVKSWQDYHKFSAAGDAAGLDGLRQSGAALTVDAGSGVLIVKRYRPPDVAVTTSLEGRRDQIEAGARSGRTLWPLEVRVKDGPFAGQLRVVAEGDVGRLVPANRIPAERQIPRRGR